MDFAYILVVIVVVLLSMTLHEAMHAFMGYWLGDDTAKHQGRLTLNPVKHIDPFLTLLLPIMLALLSAPIFGAAKPVPFNPHNIRYGEWGAALVAVAGPLTNFMIAFLMFGVYVVVGMPDGFTGLIFATVIKVNLGFFIFNMIPLPPLDGSRVIYALAPEFVRRGMEVMEQFGVIIIFAIVLVASSAIGGFMAAAIDFFVVLFGYLFGVA
jgi:Zn-dependent protease